MKDCICRCDWFRFLSWMGLVVVSALIAVRCGAAVADSDAGRVFPPVVEKCKADLADKLGVEAKDIRVADMQSATWSDSALGMPLPGKMYLQALTPGYRVILEGKGAQYLYTTSANAFRYGGPTAAWAYSMLYTKPTFSDPNMNGELYQCSLIGTNCTQVASGVADFYPQENGLVIIKRRTSRSTHDLLLIKIQNSQATAPHAAPSTGDRGVSVEADSIRIPHGRTNSSHGTPSVQTNDPSNTKTLYSAFDFDGAALNGAGDTWAAFVRMNVGGAWSVIIGGLDKENAPSYVIPIPEGVMPDRIAWSGEKLMIMTRKGVGSVCFEVVPKPGETEWKEVMCFAFPGQMDYMLNKSETLEITQTGAADKPTVEVARVWFTGTRNVKASISGLTLGSYDLLGNRFVFIVGQQGSTPAAYTVDVMTGEVIPSFSGAVEGLKPFHYAPKGSPMN